MHYLFLFLLLGSLIYLWTKRKIYYLAWKLPGPFAWPLIGNASKFMCKPEDTFEAAVTLMSKYTSPFRIWFGPKCVFCFTDMGNVEKIMSSTKFADKDEVYEFIKDLDGEGLIPGSGPKWKRDRRLMGPMFFKKNVINYFPIMVKHSKRLVHNLEKYSGRSAIAIDKYMHRCASDIVNESIMGINTDALDGSLDALLEAVSRLYVIVSNRIIKVWQYPNLLFKLNPCYAEYKVKKKIVHDFMRNAYREVLHSHSSRTSSCELANRSKSFLAKMIAIAKDVPDFATEEEFVHHLSTLYSASADTTMQITTYTLILLAMHPNIQDKVVEEIMGVVGTRDVQLEDLNDLTYLEMCINDVLRLFPIAPFIMRSPSEDVILGGITLPKRCSVIVSIQSIHRDPFLWEKPNEFFPEHFLPEAAKKRNNYAFLPFSAGPRGCLGKPYAYLVLKTLLVTFLQSYSVETNKKFEDIKLKMDISVRFKDDCYDLKIKNRIFGKCVCELENE